MRSRALFAFAGIAAAIAVGGGVALASGQGANVAVKPGAGHLHTRFVVSFTAPVATGVSGGRTVEYSVSVSGKHGPHGCMYTKDVGGPPAEADERVNVALGPGAHGAGWCTGKFKGEVLETSHPQCTPLKGEVVCPQYVVATQTIGKFSFRVSRKRH